jgi:uncharacterized protein with PIN domain
MRFLVDECTGPKVARWLREQGHEVFLVYDEARGMQDEPIIQKAFAENWILITNDKDFGEGLQRTTPAQRRRFSTPCRRTSFKQNRDSATTARKLRGSAGRSICRRHRNARSLCPRIAI